MNRLVITLGEAARHGCLRMSAKRPGGSGIAVAHPGGGCWPGWLRLASSWSRRQPCGRVALCARMPPSMTRAPYQSGQALRCAVPERPSAPVTQSCPEGSPASARQRESVAWEPSLRSNKDAPGGRPLVVTVRSRPAPLSNRSETPTGPGKGQRFDPNHSHLRQPCRALTRMARGRIFTRPSVEAARSVRGLTSLAASVA
jgi:hypothetical protein